MKKYLKIPKHILKKFFTPRNLVIEPIAGCNVVCSACPQNQLKRPYGVMKYEAFKTIIDKTKPRSIGLYFMGEPLLNPDIFKMIEYAHINCCKTTINTNGTTLFRDYQKIADSHLDKITIAIDGYSQEVFESYRHGINAETVWLGLKHLSMANSHVDKGPHIQVRTLAFENSLKEVEKIKQELLLMNIEDHRVITPIVDNWGGKKNPDLDKLGYTGRYKQGKPDVCPSLFRMAITWDGDVLPCCNDVHGECVFGNIFKDSYMNIMWGSDMWKKKAKRMFKICENCTEA
jgi:MoaA/NifB/PqqE/SkfB family radical SAM enzyme